MNGTPIGGLNIPASRKVECFLKWVAASIFASVWLISIVGCAASDVEILGTWERSVDDNHVYLTFFEDEQFWLQVGSSLRRIEGTFRIEGKKIIFVDEDCGLDDGVYRFDRVERELTITSIEDPCQARTMVLEGGWSENE